MPERNDIELRYSKLEARLALIEGRDCDKYDYMIAVFCGVMAGLVDVYLVGKPNINGNMDNSKLGKEVDKAAEFVVEKMADISISKDKKTYMEIASRLEKEGLSKSEFNKRLKEELIDKGIPQEFSVNKEYIGMRGNHSKLTYLETKFRVSYDQSNSSKIEEEIAFSLTPDNHHMKSVAHWPDPIGLIVSIADQFTGKTTFISNGEIHRVTPNHNLPALQGETFIQKIFFGFVNWFGHLLSDFCGSHSSKGRGDGIPIPFFGLFTACDFGRFTYATAATAEKKEHTISELAMSVYEHGYDARFGLTLAIPVVLQDLMTRFLWAIKAHFVHKKPWSECIPSNNHKDLRMMLLTGNAALCLVDGIDAQIKSKGNMMEFVLHLNLIAWYKLAKNALKEICMRYDFTYEDLKLQFEYIDYQLELYTEQLKKIDYAGYQLKISELNVIAVWMKDDKWDLAVDAMDKYIEQHNIETDVKGRDDFRNRLIGNGKGFKIGGK